ncbi:MAG: hypothetical protein WA160_15415 [Pseudobdellovibrio sp.]
MSTAHAQKIKVKKVKGKTALIETSYPLEEGKTYDLQTDIVSSDVNYSHPGFKSRQNSFTVGATFGYLKGSSITSTAYSLQGRYGWNFSYIEFGVVGQLDYIDRGAGSATNLAGGGYFDYNLVTNRDSKNLIYGPFALMTIGSAQTLSGSSSSVVDLNGGGFLTLFLVQSTAALRAEGYFDYQQSSATTGQNNSMGFGGRGLLIVYF